MMIRDTLLTSKNNNMTVIVKELIITSEVFQDSKRQEVIDTEQLKRELLKSCERMLDKKLKRR